MIKADELYIDSNGDWRDVETNEIILGKTILTEEQYANLKACFDKG